MGDAEIQEAISAKEAGYLHCKEHSEEAAEAIRTLGTRNIRNGYLMGAV